MQLPSLMAEDQAVEGLVPFDMTLMVQNVMLLEIDFCLDDQTAPQLLPIHNDSTAIQTLISPIKGIPFVRSEVSLGH